MRTEHVSSTALTSTLSPATTFNAQSLGGFTRVNAISDGGLVVGDVGGNNIAKAWSASAGYTTVGGIDGSTNCCSSLTDANANGFAVGWSSTTGSNSMQWDSNTDARDNLGLAGYGSSAQGINDAGAIVGGIWSMYPNQAYYKAPGSPFVLLPLSGGLTGAYAFDINNNGAIVGQVYDGSYPKAGLWATPATAGISLGTLGGTVSVASKINDDGDVIGWSYTASGTSHAFLWTQSSGMIDLSTWPNSCSGASEAISINNAGIIVGHCEGRPVIWTAVQGMRYLTIPSGPTSGAAIDINNDNSIVGYSGLGVTLWTVANRSPVANAGGPYSGVEGSAAAFDGSASSDPDGDALTYSWNFGDPNAVGGGTATGASPSHTYAENGSYTVTLTVTDPSGATNQSTASVSVTNASPYITTLTATASPVAVGTSITVNGTFTDAGILDTHSGTIDWDADGVSTITSATVSSSNGTGTLTGSHTYASPGVYTIKAFVADDDGVLDDEIYQYVVVYDPAAGFVTGSGWINVTPGSYAANPALGGKASFGFVSRYQKGKTLPSGTTEFQFNAAGMNFNSSSYEWLVVSGARAQYKGAGTINGSGNYKFILTAIDGNIAGGGGTDRFRIKIWNATSGDLVFDNQTGAADDDAPTTTLGGGNIVIHQK